MGIRTPDLLHAISRHDVHPRTFPQVTVLTRAPRCAIVRPGCGTSALYAASASGDAEALGGLRGDFGDEFEFLV